MQLNSFESKTRQSLAVKAQLSSWCCYQMYFHKTLFLTVGGGAKGHTSKRLTSKKAPGKRLQATDLEKVVRCPLVENSEFYNVLKIAYFIIKNMCIKCGLGMFKSANLNIPSSNHNPQPSFLNFGFSICQSPSSKID